MMSSTSSCIDGYDGNFMMHQQVSNIYNQKNNKEQARHLNGSYGNQNEWAGVSIVKSSGDSRHKKIYSSRSNGCTYDESSMSRLAKHTHGAPIIMASRYRSKSVKFVQSFAHENEKLRNRNSNGFSKGPSSDEMHNYEDSGYLASGTCLPRIIKPRKRRKKDRKPIASASMENNPLSPFTFTSNQSNGFSQSINVNSNNSNSNSFQNNINENFKRPAPPNDSNLFFNRNFDTSIVFPLPSSTSSSPISLSNSSLSSSSTSSCSCQLCDPNCKIWAFPLRRSFSDNSAELDHRNNESAYDALMETSKKDVGVIGGNRVKTSSCESKYSILNLIELNDPKIQKNSLIADINRLRSESLSDSGDSGCDLLLGSLNISDDILSSTIKTVGDCLTNESLNSLTRQLSKFSLIAAQSSNAMTKNINFKHSDSGHLDASDAKNSDDSRICIDELPAFQFNTISKSLSSCEFSDHQHRSNLDNLLAMNMTTSGSDCNYGSLMSPMIDNKQNFSNKVDLNNNQGEVSVVDVAIDCLNEQTLLFDCFDAAWKSS